MKPVPVHRYLFSKEEVVAALFDNALPCQYQDVRVEGDEVVVEFVNPRIVDDAPAKPQDPDGDFPGDQPSAPVEARRSPAGDNEREAVGLCASKAFQTFLEVKTEEAARRVLLDRCRAADLQQLDTEKYKKANFRDVVAEYEMWMRG